MKKNSPAPLKTRMVEKSSRPPLARMIRLHEELQAGTYPNCRTLAVEFEVSGKTIQRDLEFMRDQLGLPLEYDAKKFGYHYTEQVTAFPSMQVSEGELVALFVAQKALAQYQGTAFERPLAAAFKKLSESLPEEVTVEFGSLESYFSFRTVGAAVSDLELFGRVSEALRHSRELSFEYRKLNSTGHEPRRVQPYHMACVENQWYLFAWDKARRGLRTFVLNRMRKACLEEAEFVRPKDFSIANLLEGSFGVHSGSEKIKVRVHFDAFAAQLVREKVWHQTQKLKDKAGVSWSWR
ncbi:MAG: WYL domain-containing protein [Blastochloris sp.]|nr:WYL domain-containing protein [Blastochloris sp.]